VLKPVNRHIVVKYKPQEEKTNSDILLPDDYKPPERNHVVTEVLAVADDISFSCKKGDKLVIDKKMLEEITVEDSTYYLILENYVIGVLEDGQGFL
jgi:co-chaperonin GroES (HSP10)